MENQLTFFNQFELQEDQANDIQGGISTVDIVML